VESFSEILRFIGNRTIVVSELSNFYISCNCILSSFNPEDPSGSAGFEVGHHAYTI